MYGKFVGSLRVPTPSFAVLVQNSLVQQVEGPSRVTARGTMAIFILIYRIIATHLALAW